MKSIKTYLDSNSEHNEETSAIQYRFGYVAFTSNEFMTYINANPIISNWKVYGFSDIKVLCHPELDVNLASHANGNVIVIGTFFNPIDKIFCSRQIANELASIEFDSDLFFEALKPLSGRFVVFKKSKTGWIALPDAFGSKQRFFSARNNGIISSHCNLLAQLTNESIFNLSTALILHEHYRRRDVKYLPGLITEYEDIYYCPSNHYIEINTSKIKRFWPNKNIKHNDIAIVDNVFIRYLDGYSDYIKESFDFELFGLTGGLDSRTLLSCLLAKDVSINSFTIFRGDQGGNNRKDLNVACKISQHLNFDHQIIDASQQSTKYKNYFSSIRNALRDSSGFHRMNASYASALLYDAYKDRVASGKSNYSRGFGGELLRGFYHGTKHSITQATSDQLALAYGLLSGSQVVKNCFSHFIESLEYDLLYDVDINDIFYAEHRMSSWGAVALNETDITSHTMVGYNNRTLYEAFMGLNYDVRKTRSSFFNAISFFEPKLHDIEVC